MMDDSADSHTAVGDTANVNTADHHPTSSTSSGYNSSVGSSSSSQYSSKRIHPLPPLQPIYESGVDSLPQVAFGNAAENNKSSSATRKDKDDKVATTNDKSKPKRTPTTRSKRRRRNFNRNMLLPESQGVDDATNDESDENDMSNMTTKQQPQSNTRYLGAILLICGIFVLEYTRNVGQATHSFDSKNKSSGDDRNPRNLKKKRGSIRAATAGGARGNDAFDSSRQKQPGASPSFATSLARRLVTFRHHEENGHAIVLPEIYQNLADLEPLPADDEERPSLEDMVSNQGGRKGPIPFYWHIFRSGGQTAKTIMGQCLGLTLAAEVGGYSNPELEQQSNHIPLIRAQGGDAVYLNVNTATVEGLEHASNLGLTSRYNPDVVTSPLLYEATDILFGSDPGTNDEEAQQQQHGLKQLQPQGQLFVFLRDPIDRAISSFYCHRKVGTFGPAAAVLDIDDHIRTNEAETNYLVRSIVHKPTGVVTPDDLAVAKEVLRRKALIGLLDDKEVSLRRFKAYFGWTNCTLISLIERRWNAKPGCWSMAG